MMRTTTTLRVYKHILPISFVDNPKFELELETSLREILRSRQSYFEKLIQKEFIS